MQSLGNEDWGNSAATMRVLVADQEPEMLEAIARVFEVDVATTKATCIDLLRANHFDVLVACERLGDGSGLELLSQVGQRWPHVIRILAIEPERRAMLRGRLGPFKLFETLSYPIDEQKLEAALERAAEQIATNEARHTPSSTGERSGSASPPTARPAPVGVVSNSGPRPADVTRSSNPGGGAKPTSSTSPARMGAAPAAYSGPTRSGQAAAVNEARTPNAVRSTAVASKGGARLPNATPSRNQSSSSNASPWPNAPRTTQSAPKDDARSPGGRTAQTASAPLPRNLAPSSPGGRAPQGASFAGKPKPETGYPPLPSKGSKIVPLGSPAAGSYKILPHNYEQVMPRTLRSNRDDADQKKSSLPEKAASLAAEALSKVSRYIKPGAESDPDEPAPPRKKR
jgi:DNA-binding NarL/FixJ family response regulator